MRYRAELSKEAEEQLTKFPCKVRDRLERAIDELEERDDSQWSNMKALQGKQWKGRYRLILRKFPERGAVEISALLIKSKDTYR